MEVAGLGLALVATADLCLKYGKALVVLCEDIRNADTEARELLLVVVALWYRIERQMVVLRRVSSSLSEDLQMLQNQLLAVLQIKLQELHLKVEKLSSGSAFHRKLLYAVYSKESLQKSVKGLESWYTRWDPSWFLITLLPGPEIDAAIRQQQRVPDNTLARHPVSIVAGLRNVRTNNADRRSTSFDFLPDSVEFYLPSPVKSSAAILCARSDSHSIVVLDNIQYRPETREADVTQDVQTLCQVLSELDPLTCNLLRCEGVKKYTDADGKLQGFSLVFQVPTMTPCSPANLAINEKAAKDTDPTQDIRSLRHLLASSTPKSLTHRMVICRSLARSVIFLHSASFVHKNIRPETVLTTASGSSYLVGFQHFRTADSHTFKVGDTIWPENLYRHPTRQGQAPEDTYTMRHDIYSIGVCLLEIGLWTSFVEYGSDSVAAPGIPEIEAVLPVQDQRKRAFDLKRMFVDLAKERLPSHMGDRFTEVVVSCLTCLDKDSTFGTTDGQSDDNDGVVLGVQYIQKVLMQLFTAALGLQADSDRFWTRLKRYRSDEEPTVHTLRTKY